MIWLINNSLYGLIDTINLNWFYFLKKIYLFFFYYFQREICWILSFFFWDFIFFVLNLQCYCHLLYCLNDLINMYFHIEICISIITSIKKLFKIIKTFHLEKKVKLKLLIKTKFNWTKPKHPGLVCYLIKAINLIWFKFLFKTESIRLCSPLIYTINKETISISNHFLVKSLS